MIRYDGDPTPEVIQKLIDGHKEEVERYQRLQRYYEGKNDILDRTKKDDDKPNNKIVSGYPSYIIDIMQGYFMGKPVNYTSSEESLIGEIQDIFNYNDEADENSELSKEAGIKGKAYEVVYTDEEGDLRFNEVKADDVIMVHDFKINPEVNFAVRYFTTKDLLTDQSNLFVEVYTSDRVDVYREGDQGLVLEETKEHFFGQVPVIEFENNDEGLGDFERVISLIDAYDLTQSDTANDFEEFTDSFLCLVGMNSTNPDDVKELKENKVLLLDEKGQAEWLVKSINDSALENYKDRLKNDIHKFAKAIDVSDVNFSANGSGISLAYKLLGMEQVVAGKERKFKRALQKRIELIVAFLNFKGSNYDYRDVSTTFTRNIPVNVKEQVEISQILKGITSESTALSQLPMIDDVTEELEKMAKEKEAYTDLDDVELEDPEEDVADEGEADPEEEGEENEPRA